MLYYCNAIENARALCYVIVLLHRIRQLPLAWGVARGHSYRRCSTTKSWKPVSSMMSQQLKHAVPQTVGTTQVVVSLTLHLNVTYYYSCVRRLTNLQEMSARNNE